MAPLKRETLNYRPAADEAHSCLACCRKQSVPYAWCPQIAEQARPNWTCDKHLEAAR